MKRQENFFLYKEVKTRDRRRIQGRLSGCVSFVRVRESKIFREGLAIHHQLNNRSIKTYRKMYYQLITTKKCHERSKIWKNGSIYPTSL